MFLIVTAVIFGLLGLVLGAGGIQLLILGGSPYFLLAGLAFLASAAALAFPQAS